MLCLVFGKVRKWTHILRTHPQTILSKTIKIKNKKRVIDAGPSQRSAPAKPKNPSTNLAFGAPVKAH